jgi:FMN phosphatase YigB (HAD superfamily)
MAGKRGFSSPGTPAVLPSWNLTPARDAIEGFVKTVTRAGSRDFVPPTERVAVFDSDGTLWCEQPMPIELGFVLQRLAAMAEATPALRSRQPWRAAYHRDYAWLGGALTRHYRGDDAEAKVLMAGVLQAFRGWPVEDYEREADAFLHHARHPTLDRGLAECGYQPMVELIRYLEANEFTCYVAAGGDRDFMRTLAEAIYGIPPERVIGSAAALRYREGPEGGAVVFRGLPDVFDDGPAKPVRIWSRIGRRPILAAGNSNGDIPMLDYAASQNRPSLQLLLRHDDRAREFDYAAGAERALELAPGRRWTVVSVRQDWGAVFADAPALALR